MLRRAFKLIHVLKYMDVIDLGLDLTYKDFDPHPNVPDVICLYFGLEPSNWI